MIRDGSVWQSRINPDEVAVVYRYTESSGRVAFTKYFKDTDEWHVGFYHFEESFIREFELIRDI